MRLNAGRELLHEIQMAIALNWLKYHFALGDA
jgi:hypothetical protein